MWLGNDPLVAQISSTEAGNANDNFSFDQTPRNATSNRTMSKKTLSRI